MANEIEIIVTSKNKTGPGFAAAKKAVVDLGKALEKVGKDADKAFKEVAKDAKDAASKSSAAFELHGKRITGTLYDIPPAAKKAGKQTGQELAKGVDEGLHGQNPFKSFSGTLDDELPKKAKQSGRKAGKELADGVQEELAAVSDHADKTGEDAGTKLGEGAKRGVRRNRISDEVGRDLDLVPERAARAGDDAGARHSRGFVAAFRRLGGFGDGIDQGSKDGLGKAEQAGRDLGTQVAGGLAGSLPSALPGPIGAALLAPVVLAAAAPAGVAIGGALVLGFGAAIGGLGLAVAARSPEVVTEFTKLKDHAVAELTKISVPFEGTLEYIATRAGETFDLFAPKLKKANDELAPVMSEFSGNLLSAFEELAPAIQPITDAFMKMLDDIGPALPTIFQDIANALIDLSTNVGDNASLFTDLIQVVGWLIVKGLELINWLISVAAFFRQLADTAGQAWDWISTKAGQAFDWILQKAQWALDWFWGLGAKLDKALGGSFGGLKSAFREAINWIISKWNGLQFSVPSFSAFGQSFGGFTIGVPDIPYLAHGGITGGRGGGLAMMNEQGGELVKLPNGSTVVPAGQTDALLSGAGGSGGKTVLELRSGGSRLDDLLVELLRKAVRVQGGDVQVVLGS